MSFDYLDDWCRSFNWIIEVPLCIYIKLLPINVKFSKDVDEVSTNDMILPFSDSKKQAYCQCIRAEKPFQTTSAILNSKCCSIR